MAGPSVPGFDAPQRRPVGRLGLVGLLVLGVVALATTTAVQASPQAGSATTSDPDPDPARPGGSSPLAFGSVTAEGAIVFRLGEPVHAWSVDPTGVTRWQRDLAAGEGLACGPCPAAVVHQPDGRATSIGDDGTPGPAPAEVAGDLVATRSLIGTVLAAARPDGDVELFIPSSDGLVSAGVVDRARLDQQLVVVTPAIGAAAATILSASADPLRQAEFEVVHVTPAGSTATTVALDEPGARPLPCAVGDDGTVAFLQQRPGPTSAGSTHVVVRTPDGPAADTVVTGLFDACAVGPAGVALGAAVTGADGDLTRAVVHAVWLDARLQPLADATEAVAGPSPSVSLDPRSGRLAVAGGTGPAVVLDAGSRHERPAAAAVAFDDGGGLWAVDPSGVVTHEVAP